MFCISWCYTVIWSQFDVDGDHGSELYCGHYSCTYIKSHVIIWACFTRSSVSPGEPLSGIEHCLPMRPTWHIQVHIEWQSQIHLPPLLCLEPTVNFIMYHYLLMPSFKLYKPALRTAKQCGSKTHFSSFLLYFLFLSSSFNWSSSTIQ